MNNNEQKMNMQIVVADPSALGLFGLAMVTLVAATVKLGWTSGLAIVVPWAFFLGGIAQMMASVYDFKHNNLFGATVFGAYGLFWISVSACWLILMGAFGPVLKAAASVPQLGVAFIGYLIFSLFGTIAALETNKIIFAIMALIDVLFIGLALDALGLGGHWAHPMAAWAELVISLLGFYASGATFLNKFAGKQILPLGKPFGILK
jgi:uncharacterized protein